MIENSVGRERFDQFLKSYFKNFAFKPMTTEMFLDYLDQELPQLKEKGVPNPEAWIFNPGIPEMQNFPSSERFEKVKEMAKTYNNSGELEKGTMEEWSSVEWLQFMHFLPDSLQEEQIIFLDDNFKFSTSGNSEIFFAWMIKLIRSEYEPSLPLVKDFIGDVTKEAAPPLKFTVPANSPEGKRLKHLFSIY